MTQQPLEDKYSSSRDVAAANRLVDHWPVYVALLPAILASAAITVAALSAGPSWSNRISPILDGMKAMRADSDGYVVGLAKLGIIKIPGYEPPPLAGISVVAQPGEVGRVKPQTSCHRAAVAASIFGTHPTSAPPCTPE